MASQQLAYAIRAVDEATATMKAIQKSMADTDAAGDKAAKGGVSGFGNSLKSMSDIAGGIVGAQILTQIPGMLNGIAESAASLELQQRKATTVFGDQIPVVQEWANSTAAAMGLTSAEATNLAAGLADLLIPMGMTRKQATEMATETVGLAGALSEWSGGQTSAAEAADVLRKAYLGETDGLKALGIAISAADVEARLALKGQQDLTGEAKAQAKALAIQEMVFEKSTDAQKAYGDGADSAARKQAEMSAKINEAKEALAIGLGPAIADVTVLGANLLIPMLSGIGEAAGAIPGSTAGIAVGFLAIAAAAPKAAELGGNVVDMLQGINEKGLSSAQKLTGIAVGVGAIVVAADFLLTKTTGHGLFDYLLGDVGKMDAYEKGAKDIADAMWGVTDPVERNDILLRKLSGAVQELGQSWSAAEKSLAEYADADTAQTEAMANWSTVSLEAEERVRAIGEEMLKNGATAVELARAWDSLPEPLRKIFDEATGVEGKLAAFQERASQGAVGVWEMTDALGNWVPAVSAAGESVSGWAEKIALAAEDGQKLNGILDEMNRKWVEQNPAVQALDFSIATLDVAIQKIEGSGQKLTESQQATVDGLKAQRDVLAGQREGYETAAAAMEKYSGHMTTLLGSLAGGKDGWASFRGAMEEAGLSQDAQLVNTQNLAAGYQKLADGDLPGAITEFLNLKNTLDPATWAIIAEAVGPKFIKTVTDGVASPEQAALINSTFGTTAAKAGEWFGTELAATAPTGVSDFASAVSAEAAAQSPTISTSFQNIGGDAADGFAAGIRAKVEDVAAAAWNMVRRAMSSAAAAQDSESPSLEYKKLGIWAGQGYADGLKESEPMVADAAGGMVEAGYEDAWEQERREYVEWREWRARMDRDETAADARRAGGGYGNDDIGVPRLPIAPGPGGTMQPGTAPAAVPGKLPLQPVGNNVYWDPNTGTFVNGATNMPGTDATWNPATGELGTDAIQANGGLTVYKNSDGTWRDVITDELATNPDGTFKTARYQQDAVAYQSRAQAVKGPWITGGIHTIGGGPGENAAGATMGVTGAYMAGYMGFVQDAYNQYIKRQNELGHGALSDRFYWYGQDMSESNWGKKTYESTGLPIPGIDAYQPGAMVGGGTRYWKSNPGSAEGGAWDIAYRRTTASDPYKDLGNDGPAASFAGGNGANGGVTIININAVDSRSVAELAAEHPDVIVASTDGYRKDRFAG